jgi:malonyl-CoA O-methyltransferase
MTELFNYATLIHKRNRSAHRYFSETGLPKMVEQELLDRLSILTLEPQAILVLGAISASALESLCERFPQAQFTVTDIATGLVRIMQADLPPELKSRVSCDVRLPPALDFEAGPFDLVFSNLYLPLCDDLNAVFASLHGLMRAEGCLHFSCLGPDSFGELQTAWAVVDPHSAFHTLIPPDMHDVGDALVHSGFREPVMDRDNYTFTYSSASALLEDLRHHGVCNGFIERSRGLTGRKQWSRWLQQLEQRRQQERLPLTIELVIGQAWRGGGMSQQRRPDGAVSISLEALANKLRNEQAGG